jgi:hypothetical protein
MLATFVARRLAVGFTLTFALLVVLHTTLN